MTWKSRDSRDSRDSFWIYSVNYVLVQKSDPWLTVTHGDSRDSWDVIRMLWMTHFL